MKKKKINWKHWSPFLHYVYAWADLYDRKQLYANLRNANAGI